MRKVDCCAAPELQRDLRFKVKPMPMAERAVRCTQCGALWLEEWTTRMGFDGDEDRDFFAWRRMTEEELTAYFGRA